MRCACLILIQFLILQNVLSKEIKNEIKNVDNKNNVLPEENSHNELILFKYKQRSLTNIWNNVKNSAIIAWNFLKNVAHNTKEKIKTWILDIKARAISMVEAFEENLRNLRERLISTIQNIISNENFQKCLLVENEAINIKFYDILQRVTNCISDKIDGLSALEDLQMDDVLNDTQFAKKIEARLALCMKEQQVEECFLNVRNDILKETEAEEDKVLKSVYLFGISTDIISEVYVMGQKDLKQHFQEGTEWGCSIPYRTFHQRVTSRSFADDVLDALVTCSTNGLIEASTVMLNGAVNILKCIAQGP